MKIKQSTRQAIAIALSWLMVFNSFPAQAIAEVLDENVQPEIVLVDEQAAETDGLADEQLVEGEGSVPETEAAPEPEVVAEPEATPEPEPTPAPAPEPEADPAAAEPEASESEPAERPEVEAELDNTATVHLQDELYMVGFYGSVAEDPDSAHDALAAAIDANPDIELEEDQTADDLAAELLGEDPEAEPAGGLSLMSLAPQAATGPSASEHADFPRILDGSDVESITLKWLPNGSAQQTQDYTGYADVTNPRESTPRADLVDYNVPDALLSITPGADSPMRVRFQLDYAVSGERNYAPGDITITIPAYVFHQRESNQSSTPREKADYGAFLSPMLEAPSRRTDFNWELIPDPDGPEDPNDPNYRLVYVFTNTKALSAASRGFIQFQISGLTPHSIVDTSLTDEIQATIKVTTFRDNTIALISNPLVAQVNTNQVVRSAYKSVYTGSPKIVDASTVNVPAEFLAAHPEYEGDTSYVLVDWYMYAYHEGNQPYELTGTDARQDVRDASATYDEVDSQGKPIRFHDGFVVNASETGRDLGTVQKGWYTAGTTSYSHVSVAYPLSQFQENTDYWFKNQIDYNLHPLDGQRPDTQTSYMAEVRWNFSEPEWNEPIGHFNVFKWGQDSDYTNGNGYGKPASDGAGSSAYAPELTTHISRYGGAYGRDDIPTPGTQHLNGYYGQYLKALNQLQDQREVIIGYTMKSEGWILPWIWGGELSEEPPATRVEANYGRRPVTMITEDTGLWVGPQNRDASEFQLTVHDDYDFLAIDFVKPEIGKIKAINVNPDGSFVALYAEDGTFEYQADYDDANIPPVILEIQRGGSEEWIPWAQSDWKTGSCVITPLAGEATVTGETTVALPADTDNFRTRVTSGNAYIWYYVRPVVKLYPTAKWDAYIADAFVGSNNPAANVWNGVNMKAYEYEGDLGAGNVPEHKGDIAPVAETDQELGDLIVDISKNGYDKLYGYTTDIHAVPTKSGSFDEERDVSFETASAIIHYSAAIEERSVIADPDVYYEAIADGIITTETHGFWYDLLPKGVQPIMSSVRLPREGDTIVDSYFIEDYKGSGRTLLVVECELTHAPEVYSNGEARYYMDAPKIAFDASYSFVNFKAFGTELHNVIAFESSNDSIGSVMNYMGEESPYGSNNTATRNAWSSDPAEAELERATLAQVDPDKGTPSFLYAGDVTSVDRLQDAISSIRKEVSVNNETWFSPGTYYDDPEGNARDVYSGGVYTYRVSMLSSDEHTKTADIIIYDSLENFQARAGHNDDRDEGALRWQGTLRSVDVSPLVAKGIAPVVYYSTQENLVMQLTDNPVGGSPNYDVINNSDTSSPDYNPIESNPVWVRADQYTGSMADVHGIAVDARKKADGTNFELEPMDALVFYINMRAPQGTNAAPYINPDREVAGHAFNNIFLDCLSVSTSGGDSSERNFIRQDYTKVGLVENNVEFRKTWDDDDNRDGKRPDEITVTLYQNGEKFDPVAQGLDGYENFENPVTLKAEDADEDGAWRYVFKNLPYCEDDGTVYRYTVREDVPEGYTPSTSVSDDMHTIYMTNRHEPERISLDGTKTWTAEEGAEAAEAAARPSAIRVELYADGEYVTQKTVRPDAEGVWSYSFDNLLKYRDGGTEIVYTVKERAVTEGSLDSYVGEADGANIVNTYHPYGTFSLTKTATGTENTSEASKTQVFAFTFVFTNAAGEPDFAEYDYTVVDAEGAEVATGTVTTNGTIELLEGQTAILHELPEGTSVEATENVPDGWTALGGNVRESTIKPNTETTAAVTNEYKTSGLINLTASKTLAGRPNIQNGQFRFYVSTDEPQLTTGSGGKQSLTMNDVIRTATVRNDGSVTFGAIEYGNADAGKTFTYYLSELDRGREGYTYDLNYYKVDVAVVDNGDGTMTATPTYYQKDADSGEWIALDAGAKPQFNNTYEAKGETTLRAWKQLEGGSIKDHAGEFTFQLLDENGRVVSTATNDATGAATFPALTFTQDDLVDDEGKAVASKVFKYVVREVRGSDPNVTYSNEVFGYTVTVVDNGDGTLNCIQGLAKVTGGRTVEWEDATEEEKRSLPWTYVSRNQLTSEGSSSTNHILPPSDATTELHNWAADKLPDLTRMINEYGISDNTGCRAWYYQNGQSEDIDLRDPEWMSKAIEELERRLANNPSGEISLVFACSGSGYLTCELTVYPNTMADAFIAEYENTARGEGIDIIVEPLRANEPLIITPGEEGELPVFTNTMKPGGLEISKVVDNPDEAPLNSVFKFRLEMENADGANIDEAVENATASIHRLVGEAYAIYDSEKRTLVFFRSDNANYNDYSWQRNVEIGGETYTGTVYAGIEKENYSPGWSSRGAQTVLFDGYIQPKNGGAWFRGLSNCTEIINIDRLDTSKAKSMEYMFSNCSALTKLDLSTFNTSNVTSMDYMFSNCSALTELDVSSFDTSKVTSMEYVFSNCSSLPHLDVSSFDTSNVTEYYYMFNNCSSLKTIVASSSFATWNSPSDTMFSGCSVLEGEKGTAYSVAGYTYSRYARIDNPPDEPGYFTAKGSTGSGSSVAPFVGTRLARSFGGWLEAALDLLLGTKTAYAAEENVQTWTAWGDCEWGTDAAGTSSTLWIRPRNGATSGDFPALSGSYNGSPFMNAAFSYVRVPEGKTVRLIGCMDYLFYSYYMRGIDPRGFDTSQVTSMNYMFYRMGTDSRYYSSPDFTLDLSGWDTSNVKSMQYLFKEVEGAKTINITGWDTSNVEDMSGMFMDCRHLKQIIGIEDLDTGNATTMSSMFANCSNLEGLNLSRWDTKNVKYFSSMFSNNQKLESFDISIFDTSNAISFAGMFSNCINLSSIAGISDLDVSKATSLASMFSGCEKLPNLDLSSWDVSNVTTLKNLFSGCKAFTKVDFLNQWDVSKVSEFGYLLDGCSSITSLDLSSWDTSSATEMSGLVRGCTSLRKLDLTNFDVSHVYQFHQTFSNCTSLESLDISTWDIASAKYMSRMFQGSTALRELDLTSFKYGPNDKPGMTYSYGVVGMFQNCSNLETIYVTSDFDVSDKRYGASMFMGCDALVGGNHTSYEANEASDKNSNTYGRADRPGTPGYFTAVDYRLTLDANDGTGNTKRIYGDPKSDLDIPENPFFRLGMKVTSWSTEPDGSGVSYELNSKVPAGTYETVDDAVLYAQWTPIESMTKISEGVWEFELQGNTTLSIPNLPAGTSYRVYEETPAGWVLVSQSNTSGVIEPNVSTEAVFTNRYEPGKTSATLRAVKTLDGQSAEDGAFTFRLKHNGTTIEEITNSAGGAVAFAPLVFEEKGTFTYTIEEVAGCDATITYDNHVEYVKVTVTDDGNGNLTASVEYDESGPRFENLTNPGSLKLTKRVTGTSANDKLFTFDVEFRDPNGRLSEDEIYYYVTDANGNIVDLEFDDEGNRILNSGNPVAPYAGVPARAWLERVGDAFIGLVDWVLGTKTAHAAPPRPFDTSRQFHATDDQLKGEAYAIHDKGKSVLVFFRSTKPLTTGENKTVTVHGTTYTGTLHGNFENDTTTRTTSRFVPSDSSTVYRVWFADPVRPLNTSGWFNNSRIWRVDVTNLDTSRVTNMQYMFANGGSSTYALDLTTFDTANVTSMRYMFSDSDYKTIDITSFDTSKVTDMSGMFRFTSHTSGIDFSTLNTSNVTNMETMLMYYSYFVDSSTPLGTLDLSTFDTSKVTNMYSMFWYNGYETLDLSGWDTSNVNTFEHTFAYSKVKEFIGLDGFDTSSATTMRGMFEGCNRLESLDLSSFDTSNVYSMLQMFYRDEKLKLLDVSSFDTSNVYDMSTMFSTNDQGKYGKDFLVDYLDLSGFNTENVYPREVETHIHPMFYNAGKNPRAITISDDFHMDRATYGNWLRFPDPLTTDGYTGKWVRLEEPGVSYTSDELIDMPAVDPGTWVWETTGSQIIFDPNGGFTATTSNVQAQEPYSTVTIPEATRPGYILTGWKADGTGESYPDGGTIEPTGGTLVLHAQWTKDTRVPVTVRRYLQEIVDGAPTARYPYVGKEVIYAEPGETITVPVTPFDNYISPSEQTVTADPDGNTVVDYYYERGGFTVIFNGNGAVTGTMGNQSIALNYPYALKKNTFSRPGYIYTGWNTAADGSGTSYSDGQRVSNLGENGQTITLYAQWLDNKNNEVVPTQGKVTVQLRAGETVNFPDLPAGTTYTITETDLPKGYTLSREENASGTIVSLQASSAQVTNRYNARGAINLEARKTLNGAVPEPGKFEFQLCYRWGGGVISTATNDANGIVRFDMIEYYQTGTYQYIIREVPGTDSTIDYDDTQIDVSVTTYDNGDGTLKAVASYMDPETLEIDESRVPTFRNAQRTGTFEVAKTIENTTAVSETQAFDFTVVLKDVDGNELEGAFPVKIKHADYVPAVIEHVTKYSHTPNIADDGTQIDKHALRMDTNEVVSIPGAENLAVTITWGTYSEYSIYACMWEGNYPRYRASNDYPSSRTGRLGGGSHTAASNTKSYKVNNDTVTFGFYSSGWSVGDGYGYYAVIEGDRVVSPDTGFDTTTVASGGTISIKGGESFEVSGLPVGCTYEVVEAQKPGFTLVSSDGVSGTIVSPDDAPVATFTNRYSAYGEVPLEFKKVLTGRTLQAGQFTFELQDENGAPVARTTNDAQGNVVFEPLVFTEADHGKTFTYKLVELDSQDQGFAFDTAVRTLTVSVADKGDGTLEIDTNLEGSEQFDNSYDADGTAVLTANKMIEGRDLAEGEFSFEVVDEDGNVVATGTNDAEGKVVFTPIAYQLEDAGKTYNYTMREVVGDTGGVAYDTHTEGFAIEVRDNGDGTLRSAVSPKDFSPVFKNAYNADGSASIELAKVLEGRALRAGEFTFALADSEGIVLQTVTNAADGSIEFSPLYYTLADAGKTFTYTVAELTGSDPEIAYDKTVKTVLVDVADAGNGTLECKVSFEGDDSTFTNSFSTEGEAQIKASKALEGRDLELGEFAFELRDSEGTVIQTVANDADGSVVFEPLRFTQADAGRTFSYTVAELKGADGDVTYDARTFAAEIAVSQGEDGRLTCTVSYPQGEPAFKNTYTPPVTPPTPPTPEPPTPEPPTPEPPTPDNPPTPVKPPATPETGDATPLALMLGTALLGGAALLLARRARRREL